MKELGKPRVTLLEVGEESGAQRIDNFLLRHLKGVPKSHVYRVITSGEVRVNSRRVKPDYRLQPGDRVRVPPVRMAARAGKSSPPPMDLPIVFEDAWILVVNKPSGIAVHGGSGVSHGAIESLRAARPEAKFLELAHRLDRDTSGLLLVAKRRSALLEVHRMLRTGRTHQIRVHLAHIHHPILGDAKYGDFELNRELARQGVGRLFLHAARLRFRHPAGHGEVRLEARLPADMLAFAAGHLPEVVDG